VRGIRARITRDRRRPKAKPTDHRNLGLLLRLDGRGEEQEQTVHCDTKNFLTLSSSNRKSKIENPKLSHLITLSVRAKTFGGIVTPICLAVFRLITNSNFFGCSTGRSAGLAPFRILSM
jgi:hypothetical protein